MGVKQNFYSLSFSDLNRMFENHDLGSQTASWLFNWHYKKNQRDFLKSGRLARRDAHFIQDTFDFDLPIIDQVKKAQDKTVKFLMKLPDGKKVESVLIPFQGKYTLCISSQVGCAMNCSFCFTGTQGFFRNLKTSEIIGQFLVAQGWLKENRPNDCRILNVVFMGQGEPLHNFEAVKTTAEIMISQHGLSLAPYKITLSTAGHLPGLQRWKKEMPDINIALSLHSPFEEERTKLIPINQRYPLKEVLKVVDQIPSGPKRFVTYEYLLIEDFNDSPEHAKALGELLENKKAYINLIPFNPYPGSSYKRPSQQNMLRFRGYLEKFEIPITLRTTKGDEILAACGQLKSSQSKKIKRLSS